MLKLLMGYTLFALAFAANAQLSKDYFDGGKNLNQGQRSRDQKILAEVLNDKMDLSGGTFSGDVEVDGTLITDKDNATSFRLKGLQHTSEGSSKVQSYAGMFTNTAYDTVGTLKTRASYGANLEMDLALQSPHALLLIGQDGTQSDGVVKVLSQNAFEVHSQYAAEQVSPKRLLVDRVSTASKGTANTSDVTVGTNDGKMYLQHGHVLGGVVFPSYTTAERDALTPVAGEVVFNTSLSKLQVYDGTAWASMH